MRNLLFAGTTQDSEEPMFRTDLLQHKRILITGGGTGLGKGMAERFLELGAVVYICGRREEVLQKTASELLGKGPIHALSCDVRDLDAVERMIDSVWVGGPLDVLVNNAAGNFIARTEDLSPRAFESVIGIVLMGTLHCTLACGRRWLKSAHRGTVLNISATYAPVGSAYVVPSAISKAGVEALTRSLAVEWGDRGIRMNAIAPGPIPTQGAFSRLLPRPELETLALDRTPLHRFGTIEELANLAAFLVSDGSGYINGEVIRMDGGEFLQGAGEFSSLGRILKEEDWESLKPRKRSAP
ncbi:putative 2,4-dienoyl-CoA reductase [Candidatus Sulfotelmatobacter kueseliae]|uniref:Putative 2,4-dienoyl-CoA reductase n=1 Tax=Candidatus Sulfotelmatobacter kueseliae TaxID=2042962 RepID=A0A2U3KV99_9BACT|nr:putative 2,4-dienoyl-CoA reductase [Candidatus Sulfotelmatobacter kueseliae]